MEIFDHATTSYKDWIGTAAAEDSMVHGSKDLHDLAGLDPDQWSILAVDMFTHSHGADPNWTVSIAALDRHSEEVANFEDLKALEAERGSLPVTHIVLHDVDLDDVVKCMKVIHFQLRSPHFQKLDIVDRGDFPVQQ